MRSAASCAQPWHESADPRGARTGEGDVGIDLAPSPNCSRANEREESSRLRGGLRPTHGHVDRDPQRTTDAAAFRRFLQASDLCVVEGALDEQFTLDAGELALGLGGGQAGA
jgi:hypothetical protein